MSFLRRLLDTDKFFLGLLLFGVYACFGVIIFPGWYYETLQEGGLPLLLYKAQTRFLPINVLAVGSILCVLLIVTYLEQFHITIYQRLQKFFPSRVVALLTGFIFVTALLSFLSHSGQWNKLEILSERVDALQDKTAPTKLVTPPIYLIYVNETTLLSIYSQISSSLQLKEKSIACKLL